MTTTQLDIFATPVTPAKKRGYLDLNINERINVKGNSCGFASNYLNSNYHYSFTIRRDEHPEKLTDRCLEHERINKRSMETIIWRRTINSKLF